MRALVLVVLGACSSQPVDARDAASPPVPDAADPTLFDRDSGQLVLPDAGPLHVDDLPTVVDYGGPTLAKPTIVPVFFANDDAMKQGAVTKFLGQLPGSTYWDATTKEYGVGSISIASTAVLAESAPASIDDKDIQTWLASSIAGGKLPVPGAETVYLVYYPETTSITLDSATSCNGFTGYHEEATFMSKPVAYVVIAGCSGWNVTHTLYGIDRTTATTTHELVEAVTDPFPHTRPAYASIDNQHEAWFEYLAGNELADMCQLEPYGFFTSLELGGAVARTWSNAAASAGKDPCVPAPSAPFVAAFPIFRGSFGPAISLHETASVSVKLEGAQTTEAWTVRAVDVAAERGDPPALAFSPSEIVGKNGDVATFSVTVLRSGQAGWYLESEIDGVRRRVAALVQP